MLFEDILLASLLFLFFPVPVLKQYLELDSSLSSDPKHIWLLWTFSISMFINNVTFRLKSGWCEKHRNIKENETMTIEIIRSTQIKAFFPV
jgi:hypothetical protein